MRVVVALGGNALLKRGEPMTAAAQRANIQAAAPSLAAVATRHRLVLSHGNGPQVGLLALQAAAYHDVEPYPLDVLVSQTEGQIGYVLEQELGNLLPFEVPLAMVVECALDGGVHQAGRDSREAEQDERDDDVTYVDVEQGAPCRRGTQEAGWFHGASVVSRNKLEVPKVVHAVLAAAPLPARVE